MQNGCVNFGLLKLELLPLLSPPNLFNYCGKKLLYCVNLLMLYFEYFFLT
jgi:hypothetical protein